MQKFSISRVLILVLLIFVSSACTQVDTQNETAVMPEAGLLVETILNSEEAKSILIQGLGEQPEETTENILSTTSPLLDENIYIDLYQRVNPGVVNIQVTTNPIVGEGDLEAFPKTPELPEIPGFPNFPFSEIPDAQPMPNQGQGSGFIYDKAGHIITNNHVIANADEIIVVFADGTEVEASLVGADPDTDLAVIKISDEVDSEYLVPLTIGDSDSIQVGQYVVAIGNPFGLSSSMTTGIISGLGRILPASASQFSIPNIIQTEAAINPGNSGGPLLNLNGEVIGVNTAIASPNRAFAGVGYAVPANIVHDVVPELISKGRVQHPWLGIRGRTLDRDTAEAMNLDAKQRGILIAEVIADSPAFESGLQGSATQVNIDGQPTLIGGDVIVNIDDRVVDDFDDLLSYILNEGKVGQTVTLQILREGELIDVDVLLSARPDSN